MTENRQIVIDSLPDDKLGPGNFLLRTAEVPDPDEGEVLCRTLALTIGAGQRAGLQGSASYAGAPKTGVPMSGTAKSVSVITGVSPAHSRGTTMATGNLRPPYSTIASKRRLPSSTFVTSWIV